MSRIGKLPVALPAGVKVVLTDELITVEGPKGKLTQKNSPLVKIEVGENAVVISCADSSKEANAFQGLYRQLIHNMVVGVSAGFSKALRVNGVGYKAELKGNLLVLALGYSTTIEYVIPAGIKMAFGENKDANLLTVSGIDKQLVGQVCAEIRSLRGPEPYKGKGIKYETETIRRKVGKSGAKA